MRKSTFFCLLLIIIFAMGCKPTPDQTGTPSPQIISHPLFTYWEFVGNPTISMDDFALAVNGYYLTDQKVFIFYSMSGTTAEKLVSGNHLQIVADNGTISELTEITPLTTIEGIELGSMVFQPRRTGNRELHLSITNKANPGLDQKLLLLRLVGDVIDDRLDRSFYGKPQDQTALGEYQISIQWSAPSENQAGVKNPVVPTASEAPINDRQPTPSAVILQPVINIPPDVYLLVELTFQLENSSSGQMHYVGVQLFSNGSSAVASNGNLNIATPLIVITPTPGNSPYPEPDEPGIPYP